MSSRWIKEFDVNLNLLRSTERLNSLNIYSLDFLSDTQYVSIEDDTYKLTLSSFGVYYSSLGDSEIIYNSSRPQSRFVFIRPEGSLFCGGVVALSSELKDNSIDYDKLEFLQQAGSSGQIDYTSVLSNIATNLLNISNAVQPLTSLTNLTQLANIATAITNKNNQSEIVSILDSIFVNHLDNISQSVFKDYNINLADKARYNTIYGVLLRIFQSFTYSNLTPATTFDRSEKSVLNIQNKLQNIETKLENNLPFTTVVENEIVETNISQNCNYSSKIEQIPFSE